MIFVTRDRCSKNEYRSVCCNDGTTMGKCSWRGYRGSGLSCIQGCADGKIDTDWDWKERGTNIDLGETEVVTDTSVQNGKKVGHPGIYWITRRLDESRADALHLGSNLQRWPSILLLRRLLAATLQETARTRRGRCC